MTITLAVLLSSIPLLLLATNLAAAQLMGITTAKSLNVRVEPAGGIVDSLSFGTVVFISDSKEKWLRVVYVKSGETKSGWISSQYVRLVKGGAGTSDCETEYRSGAEVCLESVDASLECRKSLLGDEYQGCEVALEYELSTDYKGTSGLNVDVSCESQINYKGRNTYFRQSGSDYSSENHTLYAHSSERGSAYHSFSFGVFAEVYEVKLEDASCRIDGVELW